MVTMATGTPVILLVSVCSLSFFWRSIDAETVNVVSPAGTFQGQTGSSTFNGNILNYKKFLGIPFAEPPVGDNRFRKPVPKSPMKRPYDASYTRPSCLQMENIVYVKGGNYSEDCLYLNIYMPLRTSSVTKYPVMIWIHGGGLVTGTGDYYIPDVLSPYGEVGVVTINYRLHIFGFLNSGDNAAPGNFGLWDQQMAIQWVHNNIESFGGDSGRVTLMGESAGGSSVLYQAFYPGNKGLIHGVIAQSGSPFGFWALQTTPNLKTLSDRVGCGTDGSSEDLVKCMRQKNAEELTASMNSPTANWLWFQAVKDDDFVQYTSSQLLNPEDHDLDLGHLTSLNFIHGFTNKEGAFEMERVFKDALNIENLANFTVSKAKVKQNLIEPMLKRYFHKEVLPSAMVDATMFLYTDWKDVQNTNTARNMMVKFIGDTYFVTPAIETADFTSGLGGQGRTYLFQFSFAPQTDLYLRPFPSWVNGASHATEIQFLYGLSPALYNVFDVTKPSPLEDETKVAKSTMTLWTNFAKTGNPNQPVALTRSPNWPEYTAEARDYLDISVPLTTGKNFGEPWTAFWQDFLPSLLTSCDYSGVPSSGNKIVIDKLTSFALALCAAVFIRLFIK